MSAAAGKNQHTDTQHYRDDQSAQSFLHCILLYLIKLFKGYYLTHF